jgi:hypothetical protein
MNIQPNSQIQRDESPLADADLELFNGFTFDGGVSNSVVPAADTDHARSHSGHVAIPPHDILPPLDVSSSDMNWHNGATSMSQCLLSATSSSSSSSPFPSPSLSYPTASTHETTGKLDADVTPTNAMFDLNLGYGLDMNGVGNGMGVDYTYAGYNDMGYGVGDMGMEMGYGMTTAPPQGNEMGMGVVDTMWNA